jgi:ribA/ribD-fused uncharacterized protein
MNPMYNETEGYYPGFWKTIAVHNSKQIKGFFGNYKWLSNFHKSDVWFRGLKYPSSENAYQAAKVESTQQILFTKISPEESKKAWIDLPHAFTPEQWDDIKFEIMAEVLFSKFTNRELKNRLMALDEDVYLEETNWWSDIYWGVDLTKGGENNLGKLLMRVKRFWAQGK